MGMLSVMDLPTRCQRSGNLRSENHTGAAFIRIARQTTIQSCIGEQADSWFSTSHESQMG